MRGIAVAVVVVLLSVFTLTAHAQRINFGAEISGSLVKMDFDRSDPSVDIASRMSGSAAATAGLSVGHVELQSGLRYSRLGSIRNFTFEFPERGPDGSIVGWTRESGKTTISLHYIGADLRARYDFWPGKLFVVAGPEIGYLLAAHAVTVQQSRPADPHRESFSENMKRINMVAKAGLGTPFRLYARELYAQVIFARGLVSVSEHDSNSALTNELAVSLGVRF